MNVDDIIKRIKDYRGTINPKEYSKVIGQLVNHGLKTKAERPHDEVKVQFLADKFIAFKDQGGTAEQMLDALKKGGIIL